MRPTVVGTYSLFYSFPILEHIIIRPCHKKKDIKKNFEIFEFHINAYFKFLTCFNFLKIQIIYYEAGW